jgi:hypothetical protein
MVESAVSFNTERVDFAFSLREDGTSKIKSSKFSTTSISRSQFLLYSESIRSSKAGSSFSSFSTALVSLAFFFWDRNHTLSVCRNILLLLIVNPFLHLIKNILFI